MVKRPDAIGLLEAALRASQAKQTVIANNIANLDTPNFRRGDVQFADLLDRALRDGKVEEAQPKAFQPMDSPVDANGNDVNLDVEVGELVKNDAAYKTYMRLMAKIYRQMDQAIQGP